ncbi:MAG: hypothetical protein V4574_16050 [Pseudomonadota bacterium]
MERSEAFRRFVESVHDGSYDYRALNACSADERAEIEALLEARAQADDEDEAFAPEPVGAVRRVLRWAIRLVALAVLGAIGWYRYALESLKTPFDGVHAPVALTVASGLIGVLLLLWFDGKGRRGPLLLLGAAALALCGLSMRWVDSGRGGVREHWSGLEFSRTRLSGDLCYRIDAQVFALRGAGPARFTYVRGIWPGAYGEDEFKRYFFSDLPMRRRADGWTCIAR